MVDTEILRDFDFGEKDLGVFLMESITRGLYKNPLNVIREYISNEIDNDEPPTEVNVNLFNNKITISGNGPGMDYAGIRDAVRVGFSGKDFTKNVGFRGIGIYAGVAVCNKIVITTKKKASLKFFTIVIDCVGLRDDIQNGKINIIESLKKNVKWDEREAIKTLINKHGTAVDLIDILEEYQSSLLSESDVESFLEMTVPLHLSFPYKKAVDDHLSKILKKDYRLVKLKLGEKELFRSPQYNTLDEPQFGEIRSSDGKRLAVYWMCQNSKAGKIDLEDSRCLVYKKKGFTVGDRTTIAKLFLNESNKQLIDYIVGEVHVIDDGLIPNTERVEFEACPARDDLEKAIVSTVGKKISSIAREKSAINKAELRISQASDLPDNPAWDDIESWRSDLSTAQRLHDLLEGDSKKKNIPKDLKRKAKDSQNHVHDWLEKNSNPPVTTRTNGPQQLEIDDNHNESEVEGTTPPIERKEKKDKEPKKEKELSGQWVSETVDSLCSRSGHPEYSGPLNIVIQILLDNRVVTDEQNLRELLLSIEMKLQVM